MKLLIVLVSMAVVLAIVFAVSKPFFLKDTARDHIAMLTDLEADISKVSPGYVLTISGVKLKNPKGFEQGNLMDIESIRFNESLGKMEIDVDELYVLRNADGELNTDKVLAKGSPLRIRELKLKVNRVRFKDADGTEKVYQTDLAKRYTNLADASNIIPIVINEAINDTPLPDQNDVNPPPVGDDGQDIIDDGQELPPDDNDPGDEEEAPVAWKGGWYE